MEIERSIDDKKALVQEVSEQKQERKEPTREESMEAIENAILRINSEDRANAQNEAWIEQYLSIIEKRLKELEMSDPNDKDVQILREMYQDLKNDFVAAVPLELDRSFEDLLSEMHGAIKDAGVKWEAIRDIEAGTQLAATMTELAKLGIKPEYIVRPTPPSNKTVVLYMQIHPNPGTNKTYRDAVGITASQNQITRESEAIIGAGLTKTIFNEGIPLGDVIEKGEKSGTFKITWEGKEKTTQLDEVGLALSAFQLESELGSSVDSRGVEELAPFMDTAKLMMGAPRAKSEKEQRLVENGVLSRMTIHNLFIGQNIASDLLNSDETLAVLPFGAAHESGELLGMVQHPLPLSEVIAYYGCNVIVVDAATPYYKPNLKNQP